MYKKLLVAGALALSTCLTGTVGFAADTANHQVITKNGENVSPEELENALSTNRLVGEVLVRDHNGVIEAEIYPDQDYVKKKRIKDVKASLQEVIDQYNKTAAPQKKIYSLIVRDTEFEKTTTRKIKRF